MLRSGIDSGESFWRLVFSGRFADAFEVLGAAPWLWVVTGLCPVTAGALASFFPERIKAGTFAAFWPGIYFDWVATLFWLAIVLTGFSFGLTQLSQSRAGASLRTMVRRLQTLPPSGFLNSFGDAYHQAAAQTLLVTVGPEPSLPQINHAIRNVLGAVVEVAKDFDEQSKATYGANLMIWRPLGERFECTKLLVLRSYGTNNPALLGHLELVPALSTTTELISSQYSEDKKITALLMPVPIDQSMQRDCHGFTRDPLIPGAPQAFARGEMFLFSSVEDYRRWLDEYSSQGLDTVNALKDYFDLAGGHIRSFGSRPIISPDAKQEVIAVLNIHSDRENLLQDGGPAMFAPLVEPFCFLLATLLRRRSMLLSPQAMCEIASAPVGGHND
ncbi:hypothetical protein [Bordetella sp. N]|uniref:hypothetical protein n=1 Tax=Bordetella sp. N TaxID=1746199 RepID=UPI0007088D3F|nr:hypothetical protein [Bordetella sp. N]ALM81600.1 hypothetical protein ASB57_00230 [Bordetella sp. N]